MREPAPAASRKLRGFRRESREIGPREPHAAGEGQRRARGSVSRLLGCFSRFSLLGLLGALGGAVGLTASGGCSGVRYVAQQATGQIELLRARRPVAEVLADAATPALIKRRLRLALLARAFGITEIGLRDDGEFTNYVDTGGPVAWNLTVAYQSKLAIRQYRFPLVGKIAYLGYFHRADAEAEMKRLAREGYDTYLRPVGAYSAIGYFLTPIYADMINDSGASGDYDTVETILHEMAHTTAYVVSDSSLNESFATLVGHTAAARFFKRYGRALAEEGLLSAPVTPAKDKDADPDTDPGEQKGAAPAAGASAASVQKQASAASDEAARLGAWVRRTMAALRTMYTEAAAQKWPREEILRRRAPVFAAASADYRATFPDQPNSRLSRGPLNNAILLGLEVYYGPNAKPAATAGDRTGDKKARAFAQKDLLDLVGGDLRAYVNLYRTACRRSDGAAWLRRLAAAQHEETQARARAAKAPASGPGGPAAPAAPRDAVF